MTPTLSAFGNLAVAVLVGLLIGLDRERAEVRKRQALFAGVRTFPLIALAGAIPALLLEEAGPLLLIASFAALAALTAVAYYRGSASGGMGATTEVAAIVTFFLGALAGAGHLLLAGGAGIVVATLLVAKPRLEGFSNALSEDELYATLELAVISCIVLPLLPNQGYGPWAVLNPFDVWLVVVLVSALSFAGFIAMRILGDARGMIVAAVVGALVSSTAVTVTMASRSRENPNLSKSAAMATVLASGVMCLRVGVFVVIAGIGLLPRLLPSLIAMTLCGGLCAWLLSRSAALHPAPAETAAISNPFSLKAAVTFGALYALIVVAVRAAQELYGSTGIYVAAALSSLIDVDAVTIAFARAGPGPSEWRDPAAAATVALVVNTLTKLWLAVATGPRQFWRPVAVSLTAISLAGALAGAAVMLR